MNALAQQLESNYAQVKEHLENGEFSAVECLLKNFNEDVAKVTRIEKFGSNPINPVCSVVVVSHIHSDGVRKSFQSIADQTKDLSFEIVLVDNGNAQMLETARSVFKNFTYVRPPFQIGCSGGRNIGVKIASTKTIVFLDDDGIAAPGCIKALVDALNSKNAVAVRGRVYPITEGMAAPAHYDLGEMMIPSINNCEGVSAWRSEEFLRFGGFDVALAGHEGVDLCIRMFKFFGPLAFIYTPKAVLYHDPAIGDKAANKQLQHSVNRDYVQSKYPDFLKFVEKFREIPASARELYLARSAIDSPERQRCSASVSVLTTARNASAFLEEYTWAWKRRLPDNCEIIFVDDGSDDGTLERIRELWSDDNSLVAVSNPKSGRGSALNLAVKRARHDICLIADVDDISLETRISETIQIFEQRADLDFMSFLLFNEHDLFRAPRREAPLTSEVGIEAMFGMPAPFPAFAFRKSRFTIDFDETLKGGIDCEWLRANIAQSNVRGYLVQRPMVYYRQHAGQISKNYSNDQKTVRKNLMYQEFFRIGGARKGEDFSRLVDLLVDIRMATRFEKRAVSDFVIRTIEANRKTNLHTQSVLEVTLLALLDKVRIQSPVPAASARPAPLRQVDLQEQFNDLRLKADQHIREGDYKQARRIIRQALQIRKDKTLRRQLLVASKYGVVRALASILSKAPNSHEAIYERRGV